MILLFIRNRPEDDFDLFILDDYIISVWKYFLLFLTKIETFQMLETLSEKDVLSIDKYSLLFFETHFPSKIFIKEIKNNAFKNILNCIYLKLGTIKNLKKKENSFFLYVKLKYYTTFIHK